MFKETLEHFQSLTYFEFQLNDLRKLCIKNLPLGMTKKELMALSTQNMRNMVAILEFKNEEIAHKNYKTIQR